MVEHSLAGLRVAIAAPRRRAARPACGPRHRPRLGAAALGPPPPALLCARRVGRQRPAAAAARKAISNLVAHSGECSSNLKRRFILFFFQHAAARLRMRARRPWRDPRTSIIRCTPLRVLGLGSHGSTRFARAAVRAGDGVSPDPRACCASYELLSSSIAPDAYTVREVMHLQLGWRGAHPQRRWTMSSATFGSSIHFRALTGWSRRALSRRHVRPRPLAPETGTSKYLYKSSAA